MTTLRSDMGDLVWNDEQNRFFLQLCVEEKKKGNRTKRGLNDCAKEFIVNKFEETYGKRHSWQRFKNKYDSSRRTYKTFKMLTHNRVGLSYDAMGRLDMPDDWWNERIEEWSRAKKFKNKPLSNMDLLEAEFGNVYVIGVEGCSAQQGENSLDSRIGDQHNEKFDSTDTDMSTPMEKTQNRLMRPKSSLKRKLVEMIAESSASRDALPMRENHILERILGEHQDYKCNVMCALKALNELPSVIMWSAFYVASMDHLMADITHRQAFLTFSTSEDRFCYLEYKTGKKRDE